MKKLIIAILCFGFVFIAKAQESDQTQTSNKTFTPGWYLGANAGLNWYMAEGNNYLITNSPYNYSFLKNSGFIERIELGYNFNGFTTVRGMLGYANFNWHDIRRPNGDGTYKTTTFGAENLTVDLLMNLSNVWVGYNPDRKFDFSAFIGAGLSHRDKGNMATDYFCALGRAGVQGDVHLTSQLSLVAILEANVVGDNYNGFKVNFPVDVYPALTVGVTYRFPEKQKVQKTDNPVEIMSPNPEEEKQLENKTVETPEKPATITKAPATTIEVMPTEKPATQSPSEESIFVGTKKQVNTGSSTSSENFVQDIHFDVNNSEILTDEQKDGILRAALYLRKHPDAKVIVSGFADKVTGTEPINNKLSKERAVNVANSLILRYSIDYERIEVKWYGSGKQPYSEADLNRLVRIELVK